MEKRKVIEQIREYIQEEIAELGSGDAERSGELQRLLLIYRFLPTRSYGPDDVIIPSALVELQLENTSAFYFVAPQGGGLVTSVDGKPVQVITPQSPLGEALLGKKVGDQVTVDIRGKQRVYRIKGVV